MQSSIIINYLNAGIDFIISSYIWLIDVIISITMLNLFAPFIPWADVFTILVIILIIIVVIFVVRRSKGGESKNSAIITALQEIATRENRNTFLDIFDSVFQTINTKLEEAKLGDNLSNREANIMREGFLGLRTAFNRVLQPLGATTSELESQLEELRKNRATLESEIDSLESKSGLVSDSTSLPDVPIPAMSTGEVDGDELVGEMLKEIKNIADEFGIKEALDSLSFEEE